MAEEAADSGDAGIVSASAGCFYRRSAGHGHQKQSDHRDCGGGLSAGLPVHGGRDHDVDAAAPEEALQKAMAAAHGGAIYLLHAVSTTNTEILGDFIDQMRTAGYTFTGIEEPSSTNQKDAS